MTELAKGGELFDRLLERGCLPEQEAGRLMYQVSSLGLQNVISSSILCRSWKHSLIYTREE